MYIVCIECGGEMQVIDEASGHYGCDTCGREVFEGEPINISEQIKIKEKYKALNRRGFNDEKSNKT